MTEQKSNRRDLAIIAFTAFLNFTGLTLAIPIFTPLCLDQTGGIIALGTSIPVRTTILGLLLGIFPLCQFFTSPLLGALSDRLGRKKILLFAIAGTCAGYIIMAVSILAESLPLAFLSRIITGGFSGSLAVTQSAIADLSDENSRAKNFGLLGAAFGTSLFIGPALGGFLSDPTINARFNFATPFWLASFLTAVNFLQVAWQFCETLPPEKRRHVDFHLLVGPINIIKAFKTTAYRRMFLVVFALSFGFNFFTQFFQVYLIDQFAATPIAARDCAFLSRNLVDTDAGRTRAAHIKKICPRKNSAHIIAAAGGFISCAAHGEGLLDAFSRDDFHTPFQRPVEPEFDRSGVRAWRR